MHLYIIITAVLLLLYSLLILCYHRIWDLIPTPAGPDAGHSSAIKVSIIIPARNEAAHIGHCLRAILDQTYPARLTEIIVVNDFSTDETASIVSGFTGRVRLINLGDHTGGDTLNSYKKKALETGIAQATGELILCTDADSIAGPDWIAVLAQEYRREDYKIMAAPVKINAGKSALSVFQALDFIALQGITGAAVFKNLYPMCNGANLAYSRKAFYAVDGFRGIDHIASGDDMLLMKKMQKRFPRKAGYVKDQRAVVETEAANSLRSFFQQRIRWASKTTHYGHVATGLTLGLVYLVNFSLLLLFVLCFFSNSWHWLVFFLVFKTFAEYFFVSKVAGFFRQRTLMRYFIFCQPFHILYTVAAGAFGLWGKYEWKNRSVR